MVMKSIDSSDGNKSMLHIPGARYYDQQTFEISVENGKLINGQPITIIYRDIDTDLKKNNVVMLRILARYLKIPNISKDRKNEIITKINQKLTRAMD